MMKMRKKGATHIEMIISFIIFIGFLIFLLVFLRPVTNKEVNKTILDSVERGIKDDLSGAGIDYKYITVKLGEVTFTNENCFSIALNLRNIIVKNETGNIVYAESDGSRIRIGKASAEFYTIYSSPVFEEASVSGSCKSLSSGEYSLGFLREQKVLSYSKLEALEQKYKNEGEGENYNSLKASFNIPNQNNFGFIITDTGGNLIINVIKRQPSKINIIARDVPVQVLKNNGEIKYAIMNIQAW